MRYLINTSRVTHDRLDDEVIIINVSTGSYYSGSGTTADVWTLISQGASVAEAARILASEYSCDEDRVSRDIDKCVSSLIERGLIQKSDSAYLPNVKLVLPQAVRKAWTLPAFDEYTDMWDLIQLDPIHEADDAGWPAAKL